jgi:FMN-dependent NADH-azoreductase
VKGLLNSKKAIVVLSRGGVYSDSSMKQFDFQETYLRSILAFIGITDLQIVRVEGVALGADAEKNAVASAYERANEVVREFA